MGGTLPFDNGVQMRGRRDRTCNVPGQMKWSIIGNKCPADVTVLSLFLCATACAILIDRT